MKREPVDIHELAEQALQDHGKIRKIVALLYDEDMARRFAAAKALGEIAQREPELMERRWMRIFKSFDDTMSCWSAAEALGEIALNMPQQRGKIMLFLKGFRRDDCSCLGYSCTQGISAFGDRRHGHWESFAYKVSPGGSGISFPTREKRGFTRMTRSAKKKYGRWH
jgi:hypothetical protein